MKYNVQILKGVNTPKIDHATLERVFTDAVAQERDAASDRTAIMRADALEKSLKSAHADAVAAVKKWEEAKKSVHDRAALAALEGDDTDAFEDALARISERARDAYTEAREARMREYACVRAWETAAAVVGINNTDAAEITEGSRVVAVYRLATASDRDARSKRAAASAAERRAAALAMEAKDADRVYADALAAAQDAHAALDRAERADALALAAAQDAVAVAGKRAVTAEKERIKAERAMKDAAALAAAEKTESENAQKTLENADARRRAARRALTDARSHAEGVYADALAAALASDDDAIHDAAVRVAVVEPYMQDAVEYAKTIEGALTDLRKEKNDAMVAAMDGRASTLADLHAAQDVLARCESFVQDAVEEAYKLDRMFSRAVYALEGVSREYALARRREDASVDRAAREYARADAEYQDAVGRAAYARERLDLLKSSADFAAKNLKGACRAARVASEILDERKSEYICMENPTKCVKAARARENARLRADAERAVVDADASAERAKASAERAHAAADDAKKMIIELRRAAADAEKVAEEDAPTAARIVIALSPKVNERFPALALAAVYRVADRVVDALALDIADRKARYNVVSYTDAETMEAAARVATATSAKNATERQGTPSQWRVRRAVECGYFDADFAADMVAAAREPLAYMNMRERFHAAAADALAAAEKSVPHAEKWEEKATKEYADAVEKYAENDKRRTLAHDALEGARAWVKRAKNELCEARKNAKNADADADAVFESERAAAKDLHAAADALKKLSRADHIEHASLLSKFSDFRIVNDPSKCETRAEIIDLAVNASENAERAVKTEDFVAALEGVYTAMYNSVNAFLEDSRSIREAASERIDAETMDAYASNAAEKEGEYKRRRRETVCRAFSLALAAAPKKMRTAAKYMVKYNGDDKKTAEKMHVSSGTVRAHVLAFAKIYRNAVSTLASPIELYFANLAVYAAEVREADAKAALAAGRARRRAEKAHAAARDAAAAVVVSAKNKTAAKKLHKAVEDDKDAAVALAYADAICAAVRAARDKLPSVTKEYAEACERGLSVADAAALFGRSKGTICQSWKLAAKKLADAANSAAGRRVFDTSTINSGDLVSILKIIEK